MSKKLTAEALKDTLWETLQAVKQKKMTPTEANAVAAQSREIMRVVRTELEVLGIQGKKPGEKLVTFSG